MSSRAIDVAIIGGGPAGCAAALALRSNFPVLSVALLEAGAYDGYRPGEILAPAARSVLRSLGVLQLLSSENARPATSVASAWGSSSLHEKSYFLSSHAGGWHLNRNRFDAALAGECERRGVPVHRHTKLCSANRDEDGFWILDTSHATLAARFVIDASGRAAVFARMQGARLHFEDRLTAWSRIYRDADPHPAETLVESAPSGWWYTAPIPGNRRVVSFMSDADLGHAIGLPDCQAWQSLLRASTHPRAAVAHSEPVSEFLVRPCATARLETVGGTGWLATGDASAAFDPLSGQGITKSLRNGILAAYAAADTLLKPGSLGLSRYAAILDAQFSAYQRMHRAHLARETRWTSEPFWARRQSASALQLAGTLA